MGDQILERVAVVDDSKDIVDSLKSYLEYTRKITVTFTASSAEEFIRKIGECTPANLPSVVITDINMPGMTGVEMVRRLKVTYPDIKFLMLTVNEDEDTLFDAIQAGADGYLMKDEKISAIAEMTLSMLREGSIPMTSRIARKTLDLLSQLPPRERRGSNFGDYGLSQREMEVLEKLVQSKDYRAIANDLNISPHTVRKHISNIYGKLHITSKAQAINLYHAEDHKLRKETGDLNTIIVDDHKIILQGLSMMLSTISGLHVSSTFSDSREVMPWLQSNNIDLIISDLSMPILDGIQLAKAVKSQFPGISMMMLTVTDDIRTVNEIKEIGVEGYLLKKASKAELQKAIEVISGGGKYYFCDERIVA